MLDPEALVSNPHYTYEALKPKLQSGPSLRLSCSRFRDSPVEEVLKKVRVSVRVETIGLRNVTHLLFCGYEMKALRSLGDVRVLEVAMFSA